MSPRGREKHACSRSRRSCSAPEDRARLGGLEPPLRRILLRQDIITCIRTMFPYTSGLIGKNSTDLLAGGQCHGLWRHLSSADRPREKRLSVSKTRGSRRKPGWTAASYSIPCYLFFFLVESVTPQHWVPATSTFPGTEGLRSRGDSQVSFASLYSQPSSSNIPRQREARLKRGDRLHFLCSFTSRRDSTKLPATVPLAWKHVVVVVVVCSTNHTQNDMVT